MAAIELFTLFRDHSFAITKVNVGEAPKVERQKILVAQAAEAVTALRAMLAEPELFEDAIFRQLMLRATRPIVDRKKRLQLYERLMSCLVGVRLSDGFTTFPDRAGLLREAHELLDTIKRAGESG